MSAKTMMHTRVLLVSLLLLACQAHSFQIKDCTSGKPADAKLLSLNIDTCPDAKGDRCDFIKGKNATMTLEFEPTAVFSEANIAIYAKIATILIPFHLPGPTNACGNYGFNCPVKVGEKDQLQISLPVQRTYPAIKTIVRFELNDEKKQPIVCFEFPVQLKNANS